MGIGSLPPGPGTCSLLPAFSFRAVGSALLGQHLSESTPPHFLACSRSSSVLCKKKLSLRERQQRVSDHEAHSPTPRAALHLVASPPPHPRFLSLGNGSESSFSLLSLARETGIHSSGLFLHLPLTSGVEFRCCSVTQSCSTLCNPMDCSPTGSSVRGVFEAEIAGVGCCFLLQGILPTQGANRIPCFGR